MEQSQYMEMAPGQAARRVLLCEWERGPGAARDLRVLPDGCVDIVWRSDGALFVAGPDRGPATHHQGAGVRFVGVRMKPGAAATVLGTAVDELCDLQVPLTSIWGLPAERLVERLGNADSDQERRRLLTTAVAQRSGDEPLDVQVLTATGTLAQRDMPLPHLCHQVGLGERQLRRRFVQQVGYGPKTYQRVMRLQRVLLLSRHRCEQRPHLAVLAATAGYADQAHLARECRRLTGTTAADLLRPRG